jgi:hypothetical protein
MADVPIFSELPLEKSGICENIRENHGLTRFTLRQAAATFEGFPCLPGSPISTV